MRLLLWIGLVATFFEAVAADAKRDIKVLHQHAKWDSENSDLGGCYPWRGRVATSVDSGRQAVKKAIKALESLDGARKPHVGDEGFFDYQRKSALFYTLFGNMPQLASRQPLTSAAKKVLDNLKTVERNTKAGPKGERNWALVCGDKPVKWREPDQPYPFIDGVTVGLADSKFSKGIYFSPARVLRGRNDWVTLTPRSMGVEPGLDDAACSPGRENVSPTLGCTLNHEGSGLRPSVALCKYGLENLEPTDFFDKSADLEDEWQPDEEPDAKMFGIDQIYGLPATMIHEWMHMFNNQLDQKFKRSDGSKHVVYGFSRCQRVAQEDRRSGDESRAVNTPDCTAIFASAMYFEIWDWSTGIGHTEGQLELRMKRLRGSA